MKKRLWSISLLLCIVFSGCGKKETIPEAEQEQTEQEQQVEEETIEAEDTGKFSFSDLANLEFYFASGAGGWRTVMQIGEDGSFSGIFSDSDMGDSSEEYPNGVFYYCEFSGEFQQPKKIDAYTYTTEIRTIELANEPGTEEIIDGTLYRYSTPYGLDGAEEYLIYLPGSDFLALPEEYRNWVRNDMADPEAEYLPFYGFYNVKAQNGFSSYPIRELLTEYMESVKLYAGELRDSLQEDNLSQGDMNVMAQELYEMWDSALNRLWSELKEKLPEDEFQVLLEEQRAWIQKKETEVEEAGKEVEGGSLYPLITYTTAADLTEERVYELHEMLK